MSIESKRLVALATTALTTSVSAKPYTAANRDHAAAVTAVVLRHVADGLRCSGMIHRATMLYGLADEIDAAES